MAAGTQAGELRNLDDAELVTKLREAGFAAVVSGAGPSILVLCSDPAQRKAAADLVAKIQDTPWQPLMLAVDIKGATVETHPVVAA